MSKIIPINVDRNVSVADYRDHAALGELRVYSTFYTFQGEGPFAGWPAIFIRLAGCNIGAKEDCPWCDTKFDYADGVRFTQDDLRRLLRRYPGAKAVVLTGGEPMLQYATALQMIRQAAVDSPRMVWQFETNGLLLRQEHIDDAVQYENLCFVVSPKIPHGRQEYRPLFPGTQVPRWERKVPPVVLKYVVSCDPDQPYDSVPVEAVVASRLGTPVYVSGMTVYRRATRPREVASIWNDDLIDREATKNNYVHAGRIATGLGLRVSYQTHLFGVQE